MASWKVYSPVGAVLRNRIAIVLPPSVVEGVNVKRSDWVPTLEEDRTDHV